PDKGVVERQRLFEQVFAAVEDAGLAPLGELGADRRRGVKGGDAGPRGAHSLGQRALRHQLGVDPAALVILAEDQLLRGAGRRGERADDLLDLIVADQPLHGRRVLGQGRAAAGAIRHAGEALGALLGERAIEIDRLPDHREPAKPDRRIVGDVGDRVGKAGENLVSRHRPSRSFYRRRTSYYPPVSAMDYRRRRPLVTISPTPRRWPQLNRTN